MRAAAFAIAAVTIGCVPRRTFEPPARLTMGAATRHFTVPAAEPSTFRTTTPPTKEATSSHRATMAAIAFTMAARSGLYAGGEVETGVLDTAGSSASAVYGVVGARQPLRFGNIAIEVVAGQRWLRHGIDDDTLGTLVVEPRLRADLWLDSRFSLGAAGGLTLGDHTIWMAGVFLGIHSHDFGR